MSTAIFRVTGMHCSSCSMLVTLNLEELPGVSEVTCDHASGNTVVGFDDTKTDVEALREAIISAGYGAETLG